METLTITSNGTTGEEWINSRLQQRKPTFCFKDDIKNSLTSPAFKPTVDVRSEVVIIPGSEFDSNGRCHEEILAYAKLNNLVQPTIEQCYLAIEKLHEEIPTPNSDKYYSQIGSHHFIMWPADLNKTIISADCGNCVWISSENIDEVPLGAICSFIFIKQS